MYLLTEDYSVQYIKYKIADIILLFSLVFVILGLFLQTV